VNARPEHRAALRLQLPRPALQQRHPVPGDGIHLENEEEDTGRVLLERVQAIAVVCRVLGRAMRADFEDVNQHTDVVEGRRALRREVQSMNASWPPQSQRLRMRPPRKRTWFCSTSIVAPRSEMSDAGLFELESVRFIR